MGPTWSIVRGYLEQEVERLRMDNDNQKLNEIETAVIRARIAAAKDLLTLPEKLAAEAAMSAPAE